MIWVSLAIFSLTFIVLASTLMIASRSTDSKPRGDEQWKRHLNEQEQDVLTAIENAVPCLVLKDHIDRMVIVVYSNGRKLAITKEPLSFDFSVIDLSNVVAYCRITSPNNRLGKYLLNHALVARTVPSVWENRVLRYFGVKSSEIKGKPRNDFFEIHTPWNTILIDKDNMRSFAEVEMLNVFDQMTPVEIVALKTKGSVWTIKN